MRSVIITTYLLRSMIQACGGCGAARPIARVRYPRLTVHGWEVEFHYRASCIGCGADISFTVRMPRLMAAYFLIRSYELEAYMCKRHDGVFAVIEAASEDELLTSQQAYYELLQQTVTATSKPTDVPSTEDEWTRLQQDPCAWDEFQRRLGMEGGEPT